MGGQRHQHPGKSEMVAVCVPRSRVPLFTSKPATQQLYTPACERGEAVAADTTADVFPWLICSPVLQKLPYNTIGKIESQAIKGQEEFSSEAGLGAGVAA